MTLLHMAGCEDAESSAGATTGMGGWGSSSRYLLGNLEIRLEGARADSEGSSVGF